MARKITQKALRFFRNEDGPTAVVYALILSLIVLTALTTIVAIGQASAGKY